MLHSDRNLFRCIFRVLNYFRVLFHKKELIFHPPPSPPPHPAYPLQNAITNTHSITGMSNNSEFTTTVKKVVATSYFNLPKFLKFQNLTKMHSSRMRTVRSSGRLSGEGGVCSWGVSTLCVCSQGGVSQGVLLGGSVCSRGGDCSGGGIPACTEADTPPPCGQTHACKNITFATWLRTVKMFPVLQVNSCVKYFDKFPVFFIHVLCFPDSPCTVPNLYKRTTTRDVVNL